MLNLSFSSIFLEAFLLLVDFSIIHGFEIVKYEDKITENCFIKRNDAESKNVLTMLIRKIFSFI